MPNIYDLLSQRVFDFDFIFMDINISARIRCINITICHIILCVPQSLRCRDCCHKMELFYNDGASWREGDGTWEWVFLYQKYIYTVHIRDVRIQLINILFNLLPIRQKPNFEPDIRHVNSYRIKVLLVPDLQEILENQLISPMLYFLNSPLITQKN